MDHRTTTFLNRVRDIASLAEIVASAVRRGCDAAEHDASHADMLGKSIEHLMFSVRTQKILRGMNITTIRQLVQESAMSIEERRNAGATTIQEIRDKLDDIGFTLRGD